MSVPEPFATLRRGSEPAQGCAPSDAEPEGSRNVAITPSDAERSAALHCDPDRSIIVTPDLYTLWLFSQMPQRFRWIEVIDSLATPVASEAIPEVLATVIAQRIQGKATVYDEAYRLWGFTPEDSDGYRLGLIVEHLRQGKPIKSAALASLRDLQDELRHERQHRYGTPLSRTRNGITTPAKRPMRRAYIDELNPDKRQQTD